MAGCGFAPATIDTMPMQDVLALLTHWREHPPVHEVVAAVCGVRASPSPNADDPSGIGRLIARSPSPACGRWPLRQQGSDEDAGRQVAMTTGTAGGTAPHPTSADAEANLSRKREKELRHKSG